MKAGITGVISTHHITGTIKTEMLETEIVVTPIPFVNSHPDVSPQKGDLRKVYNAAKAKNGYGHAPAIWIDWIELEGPITKRDTTRPDA